MVHLDHIDGLEEQMEHSAGVEDNYAAWLDFGEQLDHRAAAYRRQWTSSACGIFHF